MISAENGLGFWANLFDVRDCLPVSLYDGRLCFDRNNVRIFAGYILQPTVVRLLLRNSIIPNDLVAGDFEQGSCRGRYHWVNVSGLVEVLELPVLRQERCALVSGDGRVRDEDFHTVHSSLFQRSDLVSYIRF